MTNILPFPKTRKRGRPKSARVEKDMGTPELQYKRAHGETAEALDICLQKGIIDEQQHWCGIHLRWLYTLRYGAPGVRALDPNHIIGVEVKTDDPTWREAREAEYHEAVSRLNKRGVGRILTNICIHNERPDPEMVHKMQDGLDLLVRHWKRKKPK